MKQSFRLRKGGKFQSMDNAERRVLSTAIIGCVSGWGRRRIDIYTE